jgi:hypothetical protein
MGCPLGLFGLDLALQDLSKIAARVVKSSVSGCSAPPGHCRPQGSGTLSRDLQPPPRGRLIREPCEHFVLGNRRGQGGQTLLTQTVRCLHGGLGSRTACCHVPEAWYQQSQRIKFRCSLKKLFCFACISLAIGKTRIKKFRWDTLFAAANFVGRKLTAMFF